MVDNAIITLNSKQNDEEEIKVVTPGVFYEEEGVFHAKYEETEVSGMEGTTTILKIEKEKFSLIREGSITTNMNFEKNHQEDILYSTPHGGLSLKLRTKALKIDVNNDGGDIHIEYEMVVQGQEVLYTTLDINIKRL
ncbi:MAG TPA: DUF1934 domain-containing protein [Clostridium sp.]|nr:DUF1934 domain-containing protein [Clostridium sp.]